LRGFSMMLCIVPSVTLALGQFAGVELRYASGLFNLMRNLGGAVGIAVVNVWLADQTRVHAEKLGEAMAVRGRPTSDFIGSIAGAFSRTTADPARALALAQGEFARVAGRASLTLAFDDVFRMSAWLFIAALVMIPFCKPAPVAKTAPAETH
jgi:DHA2 family multidrug resistance protein